MMSAFGGSLEFVYGGVVRVGDIIHMNNDVDE